MHRRSRFPMAGSFQDDTFKNHRKKRHDVNINCSGNTQKIFEGSALSCCKLKARVMNCITPVSIQKSGFTLKEFQAFHHTMSVFILTYSSLAELIRMIL